VDALHSPHVQQAGCYAGVCIELDVIGMAVRRMFFWFLMFNPIESIRANQVNTMLEAHHVLAESGAAVGALQAMDTGVEVRFNVLSLFCFYSHVSIVVQRPIDSARQARAAFSTLRRLITKWSVDGEILVFEFY